MRGPASRAGLVLASRSPARARLLADAGVQFTVEPADFDEAPLKAAARKTGASPRESAGSLAQAKAAAVRQEAGRLVLGADQTLEVDGVLFDKPASLDAARAQLLSLRGRRHRLHAAATVLQAGQPTWRAGQTVVLEMRAFSDAFLDDYLAAEGDALLGCVGAYRLEGLGAQLFERIEGDYFAVLGLPLLPLLEHLRDCGELAR